MHDAILAIRVAPQLPAQAFDLQRHGLGRHGTPQDVSKSAECGVQECEVRRALFSAPLMIAMGWVVGGPELAAAVVVNCAL